MGPWSLWGFGPRSSQALWVPINVQEVKERHGLAILLGEDEILHRVGMSSEPTKQIQGRECCGHSSQLGFHLHSWVKLLQSSCSSMAGVYIYIPRGLKAQESATVACLHALHPRFKVTSFHVSQSVKKKNSLAPYYGFLLIINNNYTRNPLSCSSSPPVSHISRSTAARLGGGSCLIVVSLSLSLFIFYLLPHLALFYLVYYVFILTIVSRKTHPKCPDLVNHFVGLIFQVQTGERKMMTLCISRSRLLTCCFFLGRADDQSHHKYKEPLVDSDVAGQAVSPNFLILIKLHQMWKPHHLFSITLILHRMSEVGKKKGKVNKLARSANFAEKSLQLMAHVWVSLDVFLSYNEKSQVEVSDGSTSMSAIPHSVTGVQHFLSGQCVPIQLVNGFFLFVNLNVKAKLSPASHIWRTKLSHLSACGHGALYHHSYVGPPPPMQISMHPSQGTRSSQKEAIVPWFLFGIPLFYHSTRKCNNFHCFLSKKFHLKLFLIDDDPILMTASPTFLNIRHWLINHVVFDPWISKKQSNPLSESLNILFQILPMCHLDNFSWQSVIMRRGVVLWDVFNKHLLPNLSAELALNLREASRPNDRASVILERFQLNQQNLVGYHNRFFNPLGVRRLSRVGGRFRWPQLQALFFICKKKKSSNGIDCHFGNLETTTQSCNQALQAMCITESFDTLKSQVIHTNLAVAMILDYLPTGLAAGDFYLPLITSLLRKLSRKDQKHVLHSVCKSTGVNISSLHLANHSPEPFYTIVIAHTAYPSFLTLKLPSSFLNPHHLLYPQFILYHYLYPLLYLFLYLSFPPLGAQVSIPPVLKYIILVQIPFDHQSKSRPSSHQINIYTIFSLLPCSSILLKYIFIFLSYEPAKEAFRITPLCFNLKLPPPPHNFLRMNFLKSSRNYRQPDPLEFIITLSAFRPGFTRRKSQELAMQVQLIVHWCCLMQFQRVVKPSCKANLIFFSLYFSTICYHGALTLILKIFIMKRTARKTHRFAFLGASPLQYHHPSSTSKHPQFLDTHTGPKADFFFLFEFLYVPSLYLFLHSIIQHLINQYHFHCKINIPLMGKFPTHSIHNISHSRVFLKDYEYEVFAKYDMYIVAILFRTLVELISVGRIMKTLWGFGEREFNYVYVYSPSTWKVHSLNQSGRISLNHHRQKSMKIMSYLPSDTRDAKRDSSFSEIERVRYLWYLHARFISLYLDEKYIQRRITSINHKNNSSFT
ncbi:hypothetical protein VP01_1041g2 [Puccinia sorghi]|uniref:Uncharacterized protein n=1 Tax=Puccinia sorghi TaxID=27349 RepID=A0A0L6VUL1_9BASI|nr:hypothetical protein VP01_1041g2 [Puccinia sorghi]